MVGRELSRGLGRAAVISAIALGLGFAGSWTRPGDPRLHPAASDAPVIRVWVLDNGFHTDLAVPREYLDDGPGPLAQAVRSLPRADWILIGWGDARFYVDQRPITDRLPDGARAFFGPDNPSVVMLDPSSADPATAYAPSVASEIRLSAAGFDGLRRRLEASLRTAEGRPLPGPRQGGGDGRFFHSVETFWVGHLCNHWTGELLHAAGLAVRPVRTILSAEIVQMAHKAADEDSRPGPTGGE